MLFLKQTLILPYLCHKLATTCQTDSNKVSNFKLKLYQGNCVKPEITGSTAPAQDTQTGQNFLGHSVHFITYRFRCKTFNLTTSWAKAN